MVVQHIRFLYILVALMFTSCAARNYRVSNSKLDPDRKHITFQKHTIDVDVRVLPYAVEFYDEAFKYDIPVDSLSEKFVGVFIQPLDSIYHGLRFINLKTQISACFISPNIANAINPLRLVVFHELGHQYGYAHCHSDCDQIMSQFTSLKGFYGNWEEQKRIFFLNAKHEGNPIYFPQMFLLNDEPKPHWFWKPRNILEENNL